jgi:acyl-coenzyme A synthetase/AMP-(fatty) acid ligase
MLEEIIATHPNILNISVVQTTADSAVTAFIVSDKNDIDTRELGEKCSMYIADLKFRIVEKLPMNSNGKIDKNELRNAKI